MRVGRRGSSSPSSRSDSSTCRAVPSSAKRRNTVAIASTTASSGVMHHRAGLVVVEPDRQELAQLTAGGLVPQPGGQPGPDQVQLGLAHRALQAEHQPVVEVGRVIDAVGVGDQRVGHRAQIQQLIPVAVVAGQPGHLDTEDDPDPAQADVGDQILEPLPGASPRPRTGPGRRRSPGPDGHPSPARPRVPAARTGGSGSRCVPATGSASTGGHTHRRPDPDAPGRSSPTPAPQRRHSSPSTRVAADHVLDQHTAGDQPGQQRQHLAADAVRQQPPPLRRPSRCQIRQRKLDGVGGYSQGAQIGSPSRSRWRERGTG